MPVRKFSFLLIAFLFIFSGCHITPRTRTLPAEIQNVYIPMFMNTSYEPSLEELATRATVEAFLADGRLNVVHPRQADVIVQGIITGYENEVASTESDDFPLINSITARVTVKLYSLDDRLHPINVYKPFTVRRSYVSDTRRTTYTVPEDVRQSLMEAVGRRVVLEVLTGEFKE